MKVTSAVTKDKKHQEELRSKLINIAERKYKKNGAVFNSIDELTDVFISQEQKNKYLKKTSSKLNQEIDNIESEVYNI